VHHFVFFMGAAATIESAEWMKHLDHTAASSSPLIVEINVCTKYGIFFGWGRGRKDHTVEFVRSILGRMAPGQGNDIGTGDTLKDFFWQSAGWLTLVSRGALDRHVIVVSRAVLEITKGPNDCCFIFFS
jgi:hypothetical protein